MKHLVFVYGTLCQHERNHGLLSESRRVAAQARTKGRLFDTGYGYPVMTQHDAEWTYGELYEVEEETLARLDKLEDFYGEGQLNRYDRPTQEVQTDQGSCQAFVYVAGTLIDDLDREITRGDWRVDQWLKDEKALNYFAYGSCMDTERFQKAKVDHYFNEVLGAGVLADYKLGFTHHLHDGGRADIIEAPGATVEGKVYRIPYEALKYLYKREGVTNGIYRPTFVDVTIDGSRHKQVLTFTVVDKKEDMAPPDHYELEIRRGGQDVFSSTYSRQFNQLIEALRNK